MAAVACAMAADKEILLIAGPPSHPPGQHEQNAGVLLLQKWLAPVKGLHARVALNGAWPADATLERADAIFMFCDGSNSHLAFKSPERTQAIAKAASRGAGLMFYHYATEPPADRGREEMLDWLGGSFELNYSVNPIWDAKFEALPMHPVTHGVKPFHIRDEWYFNIRFRERLNGFTPILVATPPPETISPKDGPRLGNADVRSKAGQPQFMAWVLERAGGGRSAGWTGGHYHNNLADDNFRKLVLNALLWIAMVDVPANGVESAVAEGDMGANLDPKRPPAAAPAK
jgi:hypothetical protein